MKEFSKLPQIEKLLQEPVFSKWIPLLSRPLVAQILRITVNSYRDDLKEGKEISLDSIVSHAEQWCKSTYKKKIVPLVNGTGTILHTNLGRSPIPLEVWQEAEEINCGYSNLEFDLESGKRGKRSGILPDLFNLLTGGDASLIVNNNASAVLLLLSVLARGKEVIVSRGEQVQIGGGFRIPDILALSGAKLIEVGTTNITTLKDYQKAVTGETALILIVHSSNFAIRGFTKKPDLSSLREVIPREVPIVVDQGSGATREHLKGEASVKHYLNHGAALVTFSADKILGGPQAGIITGRKELIELLARNPLYRAFRPGKTIYSLLQAHLILRLNGTVPSITEKAILLTEEELKKRGRKIQRALPKGTIAVVPSTLTPGGGSTPDEDYPSFSLAINSDLPPQKVLKFLRDYSPPIIGTITNNQVQINLATLLEQDIPVVKEALSALLGE